MHDLLEYLKRGDLRSLGKMDELLSQIKNATDFDLLFQYLLSSDRLMVMRASEAVEKICVEHPEGLSAHKKELLRFLQTAHDKEFKWRLAQMVDRLELSEDELDEVWKILYYWAADKKESKIVRVNSLQALYDFSQKNIGLKKDFEPFIRHVEKENTPSINARIRKFKSPH